MLRLFPLLLIVVALYSFFALGVSVTHHDVFATLNSAVDIRMFSGQVWHFSFGDFLITLSIGLLFVEIVKATRTTSHEIINHGLSMLTFIVALIEFLILKGFATSTFFLIMILCLFDVVAGYTISIVAAEHDLGLGRAGTD
ncbi:MAG TPA: hypothetical protein VLV55_08230 [Rhizomicrobium sp.]|nr:hypothetical protein [Rhizomicrobium sp.]